MLKLVKIEKSKYETLPISERTQAETMFLVHNAITNLNSIYVSGMCYGEDIDEENINQNIQKIKEDLSTLKIADNYDILKMFE